VTSIIASISLGSIAEFLGGVATFIVLLCVPAGMLFHRKVIKPLRWVLGVTAEDSPTGEAVLPVPQQLLELRTHQINLERMVHESLKELMPNNGSSMVDRVRQTHKIATATDRMLRKHLLNSANNEAEIWRAISGHPRQGDRTT
jgi:hypothetical protein